MLSLGFDTKRNEAIIFSYLANAEAEDNIIKIKDQAGERVSVKVPTGQIPQIASVSLGRWK